MLGIPCAKYFNNSPKDNLFSNSFVIFNPSSQCNKNKSTSLFSLLLFRAVYCHGLTSYATQILVISSSSHEENSEINISKRM